MTRADFLSALSELGLSQLGFARLTGVSDRQVRRWAAGEAVIPRWVAVLLWAVQQVPQDNVRKAWGK